MYIVKIWEIWDLDELYKMKTNVSIEGSAYPQRNLS